MRRRSRTRSADKSGLVAHAVGTRREQLVRLDFSYKPALTMWSSNIRLMSAAYHGPMAHASRGLPAFSRADYSPELTCHAPSPST